MKWSSHIKGIGSSLWVGLVLCMMACGSSYGQVKNPFDILRSEGDTVVQKTVETPVALEDVVKIDTDNPFSVDHIPIRKNQYQQIENLTTTTRHAEENISLSYMPLWLIVLSMCILAYMLFVKKDHLTILIRSMFNDNFMRMTNYEENSGLSPAYMMGYLLFTLNFALFLYLIAVKHFGVEMPYMFPILLGICIAFFWGKHIVNTFLSWVFHMAKESKLYDFTIITFYNVAGLLFLVINILVVFGPDKWLKVLAIGGLIIFIIFLLSRYYKTLRIGQTQLNNNFFHFFLYFCTLEFSPWVIVYKVVKDLI